MTTNTNTTDTNTTDTNTAGSTETTKKTRVHVPFTKDSLPSFPVLSAEFIEEAQLAVAVAFEASEGKNGLNQTELSAALFKGEKRYGQVIATLLHLGGYISVWDGPSGGAVPVGMVQPKSDGSKSIEPTQDQITMVANLLRDKLPKYRAGKVPLSVDRVAGIFGSELEKALDSEDFDRVAQLREMTGSMVSACIAHLPRYESKRAAGIVELSAAEIAARKAAKTAPATTAELAGDSIKGIDRRAQ